MTTWLLSIYVLDLEYDDSEEIRMMAFLQKIAASLKRGRTAELPQGKIRKTSVDEKQQISLGACRKPHPRVFDDLKDVVSLLLMRLLITLIPKSNRISHNVICSIIKLNEERVS